MVVGDDITTLMSNSKPHVLQFFKQLYDIASKENMNLHPELSFFNHLPLKYLGQEFHFETITPIQFKDALIDSLNFYSNNIYELHVSVKPLYAFLYDNVKFHSNIELDSLFQRHKTSIKNMLV